MPIITGSSTNLVAIMNLNGFWWNSEAMPDCNAHRILPGFALCALCMRRKTNGVITKKKIYAYIEDAYWKGGMQYKQLVKSIVIIKSNLLKRNEIHWKQKRDGRCFAFSLEQMREVDDVRDGTSFPIHLHGLCMYVSYDWSYGYIKCAVQNYSEANKKKKTQTDQPTVQGKFLWIEQKKNGYKHSGNKHSLNRIEQYDYDAHIICN